MINPNGMSHEIIHSPAGIYRLKVKDRNTIKCSFLHNSPNVLPIGVSPKYYLFYKNLNTNHLKPFSTIIFSGGKEVEHWLKMAKYH